MKSATEVMVEIEKNATTSANEPRFVRSMKLGEWFRQGDVAVQRIAAGVKVGAERGSRQVAVGTTTGSRHVVEGANVRVMERPGATELQGPIVVAGERCVLTHPEHAHVSTPAGTYSVSYQYDEATQRRVED